MKLLLFLYSFSAWAIVFGTAVEKGTIDEKFNVSWNINGSHFCSGVLVSSKHVLTAAHCVGDKKFSVRLGVSFQQILVKKVYIHPHYHAYRMQMPWPNGKVNDLAILELTDKVPGFYTALKMYSHLNKGGQVRLFGYGKEYVNGTMGVLRSKKVIVKDYLVESGEWVTSFAACGGDSGGALIYEHKNQKVLIGITSRADKRAHLSNCFTPSVQTDLIHQKWWIKQILTTP